MKIIQNVLWSVNNGFSRQFQWPQAVRTFSASSFSERLSDEIFIVFTSENVGSEAVKSCIYTGISDKQNSNSFESSEEFEQRNFSDASRSGPSLSSFYQKLDKAEKAHDLSGSGSKFNVGNRSNFLDGLDESFNTLSDGIYDKLKKAAAYFDYDPDEISKDDYAYRPDMNFWTGNIYDNKDLDLRKPGIRKPYKRNEFETISEEVLRKADFRNVRFLVNFITEAGIIIKRSKTGISAKAQRKIACEIKTARAFGLMPFTTMGTKQFIYDKTMEDLDEDYSYETYVRNFDEDEVGI